MRKIEFRAKRLDNGEWVYGNYVIVHGITYISYAGDQDYIHIKVDPNTVGQSIGIIDKNDKPVFEGDILKSWLNNENKTTFKYICKWSESSLSFRFPSVDRNPIICTMLHSKNNFEVIGNIHENQNLMN